MTPLQPVRIRAAPCFVRLLTHAALLNLFWAAFCTAAQPPDPQRVLVLYSDERLLPANVIFDQSFRTNLRAGASARVEFHSEFLDASRFSGEVQQEHQRDFLREKYRDYSPDLIVAVSGPAVAFLMKYRTSLFTGAPVVYLTWQGEAPPKDLPDPKATGVATPGSAEATLRLALELQPETRRIAIVTGSSPRDKALVEEARKASRAFESRVAFTWLTDLSLPQLRQELARLPDQTVALYLTLFQDAAGNRFTPQEALDQFAPASRVPIYGYYDTYLGHGIVGGSFVTFEEIGRKTAQAGLRILAGESPQAVARSEIGQAIPMFDWRELRRWNLSEGQLPPRSIVRFKEATYWEKHHWLILGAVSGLLAEGLLIAVLFAQLRRRRQAEAFLRESEERLNLATTSAGAGLWSIDQTTRQLWLTDRARQLLGLSAAKAPDWKTLLSAIHPADRERVGNSVEEAFRTGKELMEDFRTIGLDGSVRWLSSRGRTQPGSQGKQRRLMGACVDNTQRKQAEERFRLVVEAAPNAMVVTDAAGRITLTNAQAEAVFGYDRQELVGQPVEVLVPERFRAQHATERNRYLASPEARAMGAGRDLYGRRKDGSEVPVEIGLNPLHTSEGPFVLASIIDITERRQAELEAARQREGLAHLSRVTLLGELSGSLAHELNQPLTAILSNAQAAQRLLAQGAADGAELQDILNEVVEEGNHATEVIRRLRSLLKKGAVQCQPLDLNEVVQNVLKLMRSDLARQRVAVELDLAPHLPAVPGDGVQLQQVLLNLLVNGCDAMAGVEGRDRRLLVRTERVDEGVRVSMADHRGGITPDILGRLFEPFFTTKGQGVGLGLAVCRTVIAAHGGRLWATNNNPGRGATFQFILPLKGSGSA